MSLVICDSDSLDPEKECFLIDRFELQLRLSHLQILSSAVDLIIYLDVTEAFPLNNVHILHQN